MDNKKLQQFAEMLETQVAELMDKQGFTWHRQEGGAKISYQVTVTPGRKYTKVDVGHSGRYMVVNKTGEIFGIKSYGVIHRGHQYGTLDTINEWYWGDYRARRQVIK